MPFENHIKAVKELEDESDKIILKIVGFHAEDVISMNVDDQLYDRGVDSDGDEIFFREPYTDFTRAHKRVTNQPSDRVTLKETGRFHGSFYLVFGDDWFEIDAHDSKKRKLVTRYGKNIFGLTEDNISRLIRIIENQFIEHHRKIILE